MKLITKRAVWLAATLTFSSWAACAQTTQNGSPRSNDQNSTQQTPAQAQANDNNQTGTYQNGATSENIPEAPPREYNKASGLIGMDVENQQGDHLGHIKDFVVDLNTQKISYVVMTTSSKAMIIDEKLLAVPLNAFTVSQNQKYLILNADKSKLEAAAGFNSKNWPNVGNPTWGAQPFWQQPNGTTPGQNNNNNMPR